MKNSINKIIKEEIGDFEWMGKIDPLKRFEDFFYGNYQGHTGLKTSNLIKYIKRDIGWWKNWIDDVRYAHADFLEEIEQLNNMVHNLVNPKDGSKKYHELSSDVYSYLSPTRALNGKSIFQDYALTIQSAYDMLGDFADDNGLTILQVLDVFEEWLDKREKEGQPLHNEP